MKKSGLADSPFFTKPTPPPSALPQNDGMVVAVQTQEVFKHMDAQLHECANTHLSNGTPEHLHERTDAQLHKRTNAQTSGTGTGTGTNPTPRITTRESFDIYTDQLEAFEELRLRLKKQRRKHITKGELMRELLEEILQTKK